MRKLQQRFTLGKKFVLFYLALLLVSVVNVWVIHELLQKLRGTMAVIHAAHGLHRTIERVQLEMVKAAKSPPADRSTVQAHLDKFEADLAVLASGVTASAGLPGRDLDALGAALRADWAVFRAAVAGIAEGLADGRDVAEALDRMHQSGTRIVNRIEAALDTLDLQGDEIGQEAFRDFFSLALVDLALLVSGFLGVHFRIVRPLRRLRDAVQGIAAGRYEERVGLKLHDEIGQLAQAFNSMAEEIERSIRKNIDSLTRLEQAYRDVDKFFQAVEQSPVSVIITDSNGVIEYVNPRFTDITGYSREESIGMKTSLIKSSATPREVHDNLWETIRSGRVWSGELMNRKKSGEYYWENTHISPLVDDQGQVTHFIAIKEDITRRKQAEARIAQLSFDLERRVAERTRELRLANRQLETFSYSVAHDLRAPLRGINGFSTLMATQTCMGCSNDEALEFLQRIQRASVRMGDLIDDLLELSSTASRKIEVQAVDLSKMAREVLAGLEVLHPERGVAVAVEEGIRVNGDPGLLRILLENLLGNAWKFTAKREQAAISLGSKEWNGERVVFVKDNGVGFDATQADKLFAAFRRLHDPSEYEGSGIGLAIVQRIVHRHGGRVWAEGDVGRGATFYFVIPETPWIATT